MTGAQNLSITNMEQKNFRFSYFGVNDSIVVMFFSFSTQRAACEYAIKSVMDSREYCGVSVSLICTDFYMPIMTFDIAGLEK